MRCRMVAPSRSVGGTQIIDRFWRTLRRAKVGRSCAIGTDGLARRVRACQWDFWMRGEDKWAAMGSTFDDNRRASANVESAP